MPPGFNASNVLTLELTMTGRKYADGAATFQTYRQLWERLGQLPGVTAAGGVSSLPLSQMFAWGPITVEGRTPPPGEAFINVDQRIVGGDYFRAMEIPLLRGRLFTEQDTPLTQRVVVIDEHMARQIWPNEDAIGKRIRTGGIDATPNSPWLTVVGIVGRVKQDALDSEPRMAIYSPHSQLSTRAMNVVVRSSADPAALAGPVRDTIRALDPDLPIYNLRTMARRVDESLARRRFAMLLLTVFAVFAAGLAAIGIYGVIAYLVGQSRREVGIRMALGATPGAIVRMVVGHGLSVAAAGVAAGRRGCVRPHAVHAQPALRHRTVGSADVRHDRRDARAGRPRRQLCACAPGGTARSDAGAQGGVTPNRVPRNQRPCPPRISRDQRPYPPRTPRDQRPVSSGPDRGPRNTRNTRTVGSSQAYPRLPRPMPPGAPRGSEP